MLRRQIQHGRWQVPDWQLTGVVAGEEPTRVGTGRVLVHSGEDGEQYLWPGFALSLYRDAAESYWFNLTADNPLLFVICRDDEEAGVEPFLVTVDQHEAGAHLEGDDLVFSTPMPPEIHQWVEQFVVTHYVPREMKKRKRKKWSEDARS